MSLITSFGGALGGVASNDPIGGAVSAAANSAANLALRGIGAWVLNGTKDALQQVAGAISAATAPNLESTWFSATYWRVAALAALLTVPFLCAAALQALARADLSLLARVVFGYLPLSVLGVSLAAPLTMLLLAATDQMSAVVSASATTGGAQFLDRAALGAGALAAANGSLFFAVVVGLFAVLAALSLAVELLVREAAVYVVVLMLPLAFAAFVWPARRIWAVRLVELLVSLILSKFVVVAVLSLAGAAFASAQPGTSQLLTAMALLLLSTFAPWALMRILPFTELAAGAAGILSQELPHAHGDDPAWAASSRQYADQAMALPARMRSQASQADPGLGDDDGPSPTTATTPTGVTAPPGGTTPPGATDRFAGPEQSGAETGMDTAVWGAVTEAPVPAPPVPNSAPAPSAPAQTTAEATDFGPGGPAAMPEPAPPATETGGPTAAPEPAPPLTETGGPTSMSEPAPSATETGGPTAAPEPAPPATDAQRPRYVMPDLHRDDRGVYLDAGLADDAARNARSKEPE